MSLKQFSNIFLALVLFPAATLPANEVTVDSMATGGFGRAFDEFSEGGDDLIVAWEFDAAGETIRIVSSGVIELSNGLPDNGPDGIPVVVDGGIVPQNSYTPLEQVLIENGQLVLPRPFGDVLPNTGALIVAFVEESLASNPDFQPRDPTTVESGVGIPAANLVLVGEKGFFFTSPGPGTFFLGINDLFPSNNLNITPGGFTAMIDIVPEPGANPLGDVNLDQVVNLLDVAPFVELISSGKFLSQADINQDGEVNLLDVAPFVELLVDCD